MADEHGDKDAVEREKEMQEHEREARERSSSERDPAAAPGGDDNPAPPGNVQGANLGGAS